MKSIGYITRHEINNWIIPAKVQTATINFFAHSKKKKLNYIIAEYFDSPNNALLIDHLRNNKNTKDVFLLSLLQLKKINLLFKFINNTKLHFYVENITVDKFTSKKNLINYLKKIIKIKIKKFEKKNYLDLYKKYDIFFK